MVARMTKPKLTYFDAPVSRGEECRLALHIAGVDFEDDRIKAADWPMLKPKTPYGSMPIFTVPDHGPIAHSNAILVLIGRKHGLHPADPYEAARHEGMMAFVEEMRHHVGPTLRLKDEAEKKAAREAIASTYLPTWAGFAERQIGDGPFFGGAALNVVDLKIHMGVRWFRSGTVDHVPASVFDPFPKLLRLSDAVANDPRVQAWRARS
jgi:glutathione S-transferase